MNKRLIIIGAGGHGKVLADIAMKIGYQQVRFLDDCQTGTCMGLPILGTSAQWATFQDGNTAFVIGIGNNGVRQRLSQQWDMPWATLIHPSAQIGANAVIGPGTVVMAGAVINPCAVIGSHCIVNTGAVVEHDNVLEDYVHISPKAALGGTVRVGELTHIGIGAVVKNNVDICSQCVIGAGAVVVKNIEASGTYIGVPARKFA